MTRARAPVAPRVALWLGAAGLAGFVTIGWMGASYYLLGLEERPSHPWHDTLRASGRLGLPLGIGGAALMLLNLAYLLRKNLGFLRRWGSIRSWMGFHVLTGLLAPAAVLLHSAFAPSGALGAMALIAMLVTVSAGLVGRYIYGRVPRSYRGRELEIDELRAQLETHRGRLRELGVHLPERAPRPDPDVPRGLLGSLVSAVRGDREARREYRALRAQLRSSGTVESRVQDILPVLRRLCRERQWVARYQDLRGLMASWRFLHRWVAILLLVVVALHVAMALVFADLEIAP